MGVPDFRNLNLCLLASWVQRYYNSNDKLWKRIVDSSTILILQTFSMLGLERLLHFGKEYC
jgi:hypothetical protein